MLSAWSNNWEILWKINSFSNGDVEIKCRRTTEEEGKVIDEEDRNDIALPQ